MSSRKQAEADADFTAIDTDGDGFVTYAELSAYYTILAASRGGQREAKSMIDHFDANKDGKISKEEFRKAYE